MSADRLTAVTARLRAMAAGYGAECREWAAREIDEESRDFPCGLARQAAHFALAADEIDRLRARAEAAEARVGAMEYDAETLRLIVAHRLEIQTRHNRDWQAVAWTPDGPVCSGYLIDIPTAIRGVLGQLAGEPPLE